MAPAIFAPSKMQTSKLLRRRSAPDKSAPRNTQPSKFDARMSHRASLAFEKSQRMKSFQHMRDSVNSDVPKFTRSKPERSKYILGRVKPDKSASSHVVRKKAMFTGSSSSKFGIRD